MTLNEKETNDVLRTWILWNYLQFLCVSSRVFVIGSGNGELPLLAALQAWVDTTVRGTFIAERFETIVKRGLSWLSMDFSFDYRYSQ